jgi:Ethanolamine utilization protein EutJ (predicted chaperonin)
MAAAREDVYRRFFHNAEPPPWREPGTEQGRAKMDADVRRFAALAPMEVFNNPEAFAELLELGDFQGWT